MANHASLASLFSDTADAIREKTGETGKIVADNFPAAIRAIQGGKPIGIYFAHFPATRVSDSACTFNVPLKELWFMVGVPKTQWGESSSYKSTCAFFIDARSGNFYGRNWYYSSNDESWGLTSTTGTLSAALSDGVVTLSSTSSTDKICRYEAHNSSTNHFRPYIIGESLSGEDEYNFVLRTNSSTDAGKSFIVRPGMTWADWVASDCNTDGCYIGSDGVNVYYSNGKQITSASGVATPAATGELVPLINYYISAW